MAKAAELGLDPIGVEPEPETFGVQDPLLVAFKDRIVMASAEKLPFADAAFDVVYSSHALEHFEDQERGLHEMARVLRPEGLAVVVVPSAFMAVVQVLTLLVFHTHRRIGKAILRPGRRTFREVLLLPPHGSKAQTAFGETVLWRRRRWRELVSRVFDVAAVVQGPLYPYPNYPQLFRMRHGTRVASSLILVCKPRAGR